MDVFSRITEKKMSLKPRKLSAKFQDIQASGFLELIEKVKNRLIEERKKSKGHVVELHSDERTLVAIGDLHGDLESLELILGNARPLKNKQLLFLGDYGDRGLFSPEVYFSILRLKEKFPKTILLRGNHEFLPSLRVSPHDLPSSLKKKFPEKGDEIYLKIKELWNFLFHAAILPKKYLFLHGGIPSEAKTLEDFSSEKFLEEILWSDPSDEISDDVMKNPRGAGKLFGKNVSEKVLSSLGVKTLIRSHEPCDKGFKINHDGLVLTVFSRKGIPYWNEKAAYLEINLKGTVKDAYELANGSVKRF